MSHRHRLADLCGSTEGRTETTNRLWYQRAIYKAFQKPWLLLHQTEREGGSLIPVRITPGDTAVSKLNFWARQATRTLFPAKCSDRKTRSTSPTSPSRVIDTEFRPWWNHSWTKCHSCHLSPTPHPPMLPWNWCKQTAVSYAISSDLSSWHNTN